MKEEDLYQAVTELPDRLVLEGEKPLPRKGSGLRRWGTLAAVLAVVILAARLLPWGGYHAAAPRDSVEPEASATQGETTLSPADWALAQAEYPKMAPYANKLDFMENGRLRQSDYKAALLAWQESRDALQSETDYTQGLEDFLTRTLPEFLTQQEDSSENLAFAPLNLWSALAALSETTGGSTQAELLALLGAPDQESLRARANALWRANYCDDGRLQSVLAASLWLGDKLTYRQDTLQTLAENYYASVFAGSMTDPEYLKAMQAWIDFQTRGLLTEQLADLGIEPNTVLALVSTLSYRAAWTTAFEASGIGSFHSPTGDLDCKFLKQTGEMNVWQAGGFTALGKGLQGSGSMYFLLPEQGTDPRKLLEDPEALAFLCSPEARGSMKAQPSLVRLKVPEFDVSCTQDLIGGLQNLGLREIFSPQGDFSPLLAEPREGEELCVGWAFQGLRVLIDEKGTSGAAYTVLTETVAGLPPELPELDFTLDRPFLFAVTNTEGLPIFAGLVYQP
ncbi:MAG: hypothetical protein IKS05_05990 [Oscillospiraceae bacterium]|nr:hypothetical protein [Oscillospiraceae bacterium]